MKIVLSFLSSYCQISTYKYLTSTCTKSKHLLYVIFLIIIGENATVSMLRLCVQYNVYKTRPIIIKVAYARVPCVNLCTSSSCKWTHNTIISPANHL